MGDQMVLAAPGRINRVRHSTKLSVEIVSLEFIGDHKMLKNNDKDWRNTGELFKKPEYIHMMEDPESVKEKQKKDPKYVPRKPQNAPISITNGKALEGKLTLKVTLPSDALTESPRYTLKGKAAFSGRGWGSDMVHDWTGDFDSTQALTSGEQTISFKLDKSLPKEVTRLKGSINWTVNNGVDEPLKVSSPEKHTLYLTMGTPIDLTKTREAGITEMHMYAAVDLVWRARSLDPHEIIRWIMENKFPGYTPPTSTISAEPGGSSRITGSTTTRKATSKPSARPSCAWCWR
jgi:hypothetical protein